MFVPLIVRFLLPCDRRDYSLNAPSLHSLASVLFNILYSSDRYPVVGSRTALIFIVSNIIFLPALIGEWSHFYCGILYSWGGCEYVWIVKVLVMLKV